MSKSWVCSLLLIGLVIVRTSMERFTCVVCRNSYEKVGSLEARVAEFLVVKHSETG